MPYDVGDRPGSSGEAVDAEYDEGDGQYQGRTDDDPSTTIDALTPGIDTPTARINAPSRRAATAWAVGRRPQTGIKTGAGNRTAATLRCSDSTRPRSSALRA